MSVLPLASKSLESSRYFPHVISNYVMVGRAGVKSPMPRVLVT